MKWEIKLVYHLIKPVIWLLWATELSSDADMSSPFKFKTVVGLFPHPAAAEQHEASWGLVFVSPDECDSKCSVFGLLLRKRLSLSAVCCSAAPLQRLFLWKCHHESTESEPEQEAAQVNKLLTRKAAADWGSLSFLYINITCDLKTWVSQFCAAQHEMWRFTCKSVCPSLTAMCPDKVPSSRALRSSSSPAVMKPTPWQTPPVC